MSKVLTLLFVLILQSCGGEPVYTKIDMWKIGRKGDPDLELILPKDMESGIRCSDYGPGCVSGVTVRVKKLDMIFVQFENYAQALAAARRVNGYVIKNWAIDDVMGEPILEDFVVKTFQAQKARELPDQEPSFFQKIIDYIYLLKK